ncbi:response regulator, partial [Clostridium perfringens]
MSEEKILVVDDEDHIVELISYNLTSSGYKVITANNGLDAVRLAKEENPKLMLLDLMIPGLDGFDVCKAIRNDSETKDISVIMLTAKGEELDKILGLELGADDYMTKPFSTRELLARIKAVLRRTKSLDRSEEIFKANGIFIN